MGARIGVLLAATCMLSVAALAQEKPFVEARGNVMPVPLPPGGPPPRMADGKVDMSGWFHSDEVHVIERVRRPSLNYLEYQYSVEDPKVLTKPWTSAWKTFSLGNEDPTENFCTNNENAEQRRKLIEIENTKGK